MDSCRKQIYPAFPTPALPRLEKIFLVGMPPSSILPPFTALLCTVLDPRLWDRFSYSAQEPYIPRHSKPASLVPASWIYLPQLLGIPHSLWPYLAQCRTPF